MAKKLVKNTEGFDLSFEEVVDLYKQNKLQLGINNDLAVAVVDAFKIKDTTRKAFHFYNWLAMAIVLYGIYLSFTKHWWYFIIGFFISSLIWQANKKGNAQNIVNAAINDRELYNKVLSTKGWMYMIEEDVLNSISNNSLIDWIHKK